MGSTISTLCHTCGFSNEFNFGGAKLGYKTHSQVPALNKITLDFENVNYFDHQDSDLYVFYYAFGLKGRNDKQKTIGNFDQILNEDDNLCPKCKEMTWSFRVIRYFD